MKEIHDVHPLVALWLTKNGYSYTQEYQMPDYGRVDFYAVKDGKILLIEVKALDNPIKGIFQAAMYKMQIPNSEAALALPQKFITDEISKVAKKYNIGIIEISMDEIYHRASFREDANRYTKHIAEGVRIIIETGTEEGIIAKSSFDLVNSLLTGSILIYHSIFSSYGIIQESELADFMTDRIHRAHWALKNRDRQIIKDWVESTLNYQPYMLFLHPKD